jgi:hypothetical protein
MAGYSQFIGFQALPSLLKRFSKLMRKEAIMTGKKYYRRGTLVAASRNAFERYPWGKTSCSHTTSCA